MTAAMKETEPQADSAPVKKKRPAKKRAAAKEVNLLESLPKPKDLEAEAKSPYPEGIQYFSYTPKGGGDPILLAVNGFGQPDKLWFFDLAQLPRLSQTWRWMDQANVPKAIQRQAQSLPDAEYFEMFDQWFAVMQQLQKAAPKGAVTAGK